MKSNTRPIFSHLVWGKYYRVFGNWSCENCKNKWSSAWTFVSLEKFKHETKSDDLEPDDLEPDDLELEPDDYINQKCKKCNSQETKIIKYDPLKRSEESGFNRKAHEQDLCAKCKTGATCGQRRISGPYQRPIKIFRKPLTDKSEN